MPEQAIENVRAALIAEKIAQANEKGRLQNLDARLCAGLRLMKTQYRALLPKNNAVPWERWVLDNWYKLAQRSQNARRQLKLYFPYSRVLFPLYDKLEAVFCNGEIPFNEENLIETLKQLDSISPLPHRMFCFLPAALDTLLLLAAANACYGDKDGTRREQLLSYAISGLGTLENLDWERLLRRCSKLERALLQDPVYAATGQDSKSIFREAAVRVAQKRGIVEQQAVKQAQEAAKNEESSPKNSACYWLQYWDPAQKRRSRRGVTALACFWLIPLLVSLASAAAFRNLFWAFAFFLPFCALLRPLLQPLAAQKPLYLARLEEGADLPLTIVSVCRLLPAAQQSEALYDSLSQLYLTNREENLCFCLIGDLPPARRAVLPGDDAIIQAAQEEIRKLNQKYGNRFSLFIRTRTYCETQDVFCGWERKRGALLEFIRFLKGHDIPRRCFEGNRAFLQDARYLLTLDSDTCPDPGSVNLLVSTAAHPLNRAVMDTQGHVVFGYGILAPRLYTAYERDGATRFSDLFGIDAGGGYGAGGELYQDAFGHTVFTGKGLLDIEVYDKLLGGFFPEQYVLSHDILEGAYLRAGMVYEAAMSEKEPPDLFSWLRRLHRWQRGDWQNLRFCGPWFQVGALKRKNTPGALLRFCLAENLRRALTAPAALICAALGCLLSPRRALVPLLLAVFCIAADPIWAFVRHPRQIGAAKLAAQAGMRVLALCAEALNASDAAIRSLWRMVVSKKEFLEWEVSCHGLHRGVTLRAALRRTRGNTVIALLLLLWPPVPHPAKLFGIAFLCLAPLAVYTAGKTQRTASTPEALERARLLEWCRKTLGYFETYATKKSHWLAPDNVQFSPVALTAQRTSPTNIGMQMLSYLAARDMGLIDSATFYNRLSRVLDTVEKLETYRGNLYNWYDTTQLCVLNDKFVSSVDSGNFLCSLLTVREGAGDYASQEPRLAGLQKRMDAILQAVDFSCFYDQKRKLLTVGIDKKGRPSGAHYDFFMSEARAASYYAIASGAVPAAHWDALSRAAFQHHGHTGMLSWTGTMFEYFMPHLFLPLYHGTLLAQSLESAFSLQWESGAKGMPRGISESGYFAFDDQIGYLYRPNGAASLAVKPGQAHYPVCAPYASFLTLPFAPHKSFLNLELLEKNGMLGECGFYEAADYRHASRPEIVYSVMAHHAGMSLAACANALYDGCMQKRFMRAAGMGAYWALLAQNPRGWMDSAVKRQPERGPRPQQETTVRSQTAPTPLSPRAGLLTGGMTLLCADTGALFLRYLDYDILRPTTDFLKNPQTIYCAARLLGETLTASSAPAYHNDCAHTCTFTHDSVSYHTQKNLAGLTQRLTMDQSHPLLRCEVTLENNGNTTAMTELIFYFEPVLSRREEYLAHPAYAKLFLTGARDGQRDLFLFSRRRDNQPGPYLAVGFAKKYACQFSLRREDAVSYPHGLEMLESLFEMPLHGGAATPDGCCALRLRIMAQPGETKVTLLLACGQSAEDCAQEIVRARQEAPEPIHAPLEGTRLAARLGVRLLGPLFFGGPACKNQEYLFAENTLGDIRTQFGIAEEKALLLYDWHTRPDAALLHACLQFYRLMRSRRLPVSLCVYGVPEGIRLAKHVVCIDQLDEPRRAALFSAANALIDKDWPASALPDGQPFIPAPIAPVEPLPIPSRDGLEVVGGKFIGRGFYVDRVTPLPFSHILANRTIGTLLQDSGLGCTWFRNAHECRISQWHNDISGGSGEKLWLSLDGQSYDLCRGARAYFSTAQARYLGRAKNVRVTVRVSISPRGGVKYLDVCLYNESEKEEEIMCAYAMEPVFGVQSRHGRFTQFEQEHSCLLLHSQRNVDVPCYVALHVPGEYPSYLCRRAPFYAGDWAAQELVPNNDPIAGTVVRKRLPPRRRVRIRYILAAAATRSAALALAQTSNSKAPSRQERHIEIGTPSPALDRFINHFAPHQIKAGRIYGRCGFYQCSGAWGFRDQLQDAGAYLPLDPAIAGNQILRCCAAQFAEGDVLHWWHDLPTGRRGIRTRFSDDLLWLPFTVCDYLDVTQDKAFLKIPVRCCRGEALSDQEQERYMQVSADGERLTVYEHCLRAIGHVRLGSKGIPLIGCGDWNDGFSRVGAGGQGQSVWLAMFYAWILERFAPWCEEMGELAQAGRMRERAKKLRAAVDKNCWDEKWYQRAYFDDGTPIGAKQSEECRIDSLPQSFSVFCGMPRKRRRTAIETAVRRLVDEQRGIVKLFTPPFDKTARDPGYIKAYPPGIRENGGQYTHASVWLALALLREGKAADGWRLLDMLNPASRCTTAQRAMAYKTEPYFMAADIYTNHGVYGHGGWTLYTGAAGWYYRAVLDGLLGLRFCGQSLYLHPTLPPDWTGFHATIREGGVRYKITVCRTGEAGLTVDGEPARFVPLDGMAHDAVCTI